ncbi:FAD-dependent oxidoreductase [Brevundimonas sp.]|uniref:NAD(P)/FAD-dependent oxidoreductase n=2 Tax=unclassified Brevundimonas TaxID=2622653 RepID=UPI0028A27342|nr:FAD-dependent oxidoreductase [Brevundimonas sp.]
MPLINSPMTRFDFIILGAGAFGLATAAELRLSGHRVAVVAPRGGAASAVAAGMIAPAFETAIDGLSVEQANILKAGRILWADFATRTGVHLQHMPAEWRGEGADRLAIALERNEFEYNYMPDHQWIVTEEDAKLDPEAALEVLSEGVERVDALARSVAFEDGVWTVDYGTGAASAPQMVIASGAAAAIEGMPETVKDLIGKIVPIRGQIGITHERFSDHVIRGPGAYIAPVNAGPYEGGSVVGATMEEGVRELATDAALCERMMNAAWALLGHEPVEIEMKWRAGIRGASPDGMPMAGPVGDGLHVALAPRRNGWLLAPLVAGQVVAGIEGLTLPEPALDPLRFNPSH